MLVFQKVTSVQRIHVDQTVVVESLVEDQNVSVFLDLKGIHLVKHADHLKALVTLHLADQTHNVHY
jgi:hypothetical protein